MSNGYVELEFNDMFMEIIKGFWTEMICDKSLLNYFAVYILHIYLLYYMFKSHDRISKNKHFFQRKMEKKLKIVENFNCP